MKKVLIMASLFWPQKKSGGPPISIFNLVQSIKDKFDIYIISKNHEINEDKPLDGIINGWNELTFGKAYYTAKGEHSFKNIYATIKSVNPDVIYQNSFFSIDDLLPVLVYKLFHKEIKVIIAPRGEFYPERMSVGQVKKYIYIKLFRYSGILKNIYFQGTSLEECQQERRLLGISDDHILNINNLSLVDIKNSTPLKKRKAELKLVYIARVHPTKNTLKAIDLLHHVPLRITYDIYGPIEDKDYWLKCQCAIKTLPNNIQVRYKGIIEHDKISFILNQYHAYYMPTTGENFGHSIVEAMMLGKPVIISDQTPWTDVNDHGGYAIALNDEKKFISTIQSLALMDQKDYSYLSKQIRHYIVNKLDLNSIVNQYISAFNGE